MNYPPTKDQWVSSTEKDEAKDKKRLRSIIAELNCNVEIIFDGWDGYDDWY